MIQWNALMNAPNAGHTFMQSFNHARQMGIQEEDRREMRDLRREQIEVQKQGAAQKQLEAHRENIVRGAQIIRQVQPKDQASWDQARALAAQMGIDVSQVPAVFDPQYVQGLVSIADAFEPEKQSNGQLVPFTPGGGVARFNPQTGQVEVIVQPNDGSQPVGSPVNAPPVLTDEDILRMEQGGQSPSGSGGFL